ncbi:MAG: hypothetical protein FJZ15_06470, partial [Candidatus Omnitrophica bacterium]|nr:hypothetical protein [Candidatus Omnitrophota bacterium]
MADAGINTVRTYFTPHKDLLDAFAQHGIRVIVGFPNYDDRHQQGADVARGGYKNYINTYKNHPAILMWEFGNEYNYHPDWFEGNDINIWYRNLEEAARTAIKLDPNHPTSSAHGEAPSPSVLKKCPSVQVWGMNIYIGTDMTEELNNWRAISDKPMYISETGIDSFNDAAKTEDEDAQAKANVLMWQSINNSRDICSGVTFMTWQDEWWKVEKGNPNGQDRHGVNSLPSVNRGDQFSEEFWGFVNIDGTPKKVLGAMAEQWAPKTKSDVSPDHVSQRNQLSGELNNLALRENALKAEIKALQDDLNQLAKPAAAPAAAELSNEAKLEAVQGRLEELKFKVLTYEERIERNKLLLEERILKADRAAAKIKADIEAARAELNQDRGNLTKDTDYAQQMLFGQANTIIGFTPKFKDEIEKALVEGKNQAVIDALMPYMDYTLEKDKKMLDPGSSAFRDLAYAEATVGRIYFNYLQLRETYYQMIQNGKVKNKQELISLYAAFKQDFANSMLTLGKLGNTNFGVQIGGDLAPIVDAVNIIYGFAEGQITDGTNIAMAGLALYDDITLLIQQPANNKLKEIGGLMIPLKEEVVDRLGITILGTNIGFGKEGLFGKDPGNLIGLRAGKIFNLTVGEQTQIAANIWVAKVQVGVDFKNRLRNVFPNLILNGSFIGDSLYIVKTDYGRYIFFPTIVSDDGTNKFQVSKSTDYYNLENIGEAINKLIAGLLTHEPQYRDLPAIYIPSLAQQEAYRRATTSEEADMEYYIDVDLDTHLQIIYRHNLTNDTWEYVSVANMYYRTEDKTRVEDGDKFAPTEPFLRLTGQWPWKTDLEEKLYPHKLMRVSGLRDFSNLD